MGNLTVIHATKYTSSAISSGALGRHIDRKCISKNVDQERTRFNLGMDKKDLSLKQAIDKRIEEGYKGKKKLRDNAVRSIGFILSGSHEQMKKIEKKGEIKDWAKDSISFIAEEFGGVENIVRAEVHMDEKTPHIHLQVVPITPDGRLSAKEMLDKKKLKKLQDDYPKLMKKYGLTRGISGSKRKHITTEQFYRLEEEKEKAAEQILKNNDKKIVVQLLTQAINEQKRQKLALKGTKKKDRNFFENPQPKKKGPKI